MNNSPKVLVRTLPLSRGNYGCILQAFALQRALEALGFEATTDASERVDAKVALKRAAARLATRLAGRPLGYRERMRVGNAQLHEFINSNVRTTRIFRWDLVPHLARVSSYDVLLAGSDQVWRPEYGDLNSYLFDFAEPTMPRIAYAASFGVSDPHIERERTQPLVDRFASISVREQSAVGVVARLWGKTVERAPDPTLLLAAQEYEDLLVPRPNHTATPSVLVYVLDKSQGSQEIVLSAAESTGFRVVDLARPLPLSAADFRREPSSFERPSVEEWLASIRDAGVVVTDSFHGTVFSILFTRPFVTLANPGRGLARLESLLETFGLQDRLVLSTDNNLEARVRHLLKQDVQWDQVRSRTQEERSRGLEILSNALMAATRN